MLQELCRLIEFFYESGLLVAAAAGPSGCRGACPCGRWQAMSPPARDAAAGWRWLEGWSGLPYVFESFYKQKSQGRCPRLVSAHGYGAAWVGGRARCAAVGAVLACRIMVFDGRNGLRRMPIRAVLACRTGRFTPARRCLGWLFWPCPARNGCKPAGWLVCPHLAIQAG